MFFFKLLLAYPVLPCTYTQIYTMAISYGDLNFYLQHYGTLKHWYTIFSTTLGIHNLRSSLWPSILIQSPSHCDKFKMSNSKSRLSPFNHTCHDKESSSYRNVFGSDCWIILIILFWNRFITELIVCKFCTNLKNSVRNILTKRWLDFLSFHECCNILCGKYKNISHYNTHAIFTFRSNMLFVRFTLLI